LRPLQTPHLSSIADIGTAAINTANGAANPKRNVFRALLDQVNEQSGSVIVSPLSSEVARLTEANGSDYQTEKQNLATRLGVDLGQILTDVNTQTGVVQASMLRESNILTNRFAYAITKLDRGDLQSTARLEKSHTTGLNLCRFGADILGPAASCPALGILSYRVERPPMPR
jgi:hypothetical protein